MLRRQRSHAAAAPSAVVSSAADEAEEDDYPPAPLGLTRAALRIKTAPASRPGSGEKGAIRDANGHGDTASVGGNGGATGRLMRRVSSLFRASSAAPAVKIGEHRNRTAARAFGRADAAWPGLGSPSYKAASSSPDITSRAFTFGGGGGGGGGGNGNGKLVKRPSVKHRNAATRSVPENMASRVPWPISPRAARSKPSAAPASPAFGGGLGNGHGANAQAAQGRMKPLPRLSDAGDDEAEAQEGAGTGEDEDEIRRPSGLGRTSLSNGDGDGGAASVEDTPASADAPHTPQPTAFPRASTSSAAATVQSDDDTDDDIRCPAGLGRAASIRDDGENDDDDSAAAARAVRPWERARHGSGGVNGDGAPRARAVSLPASTLLHTLLGLPAPAVAACPPWVWRAVMARLAPADAARAARVSRALCEAARARLYAVVDLRFGRAQRDALRAPHLAALVEGLVCAGWPPRVGAVCETVSESTSAAVVTFLGVGVGMPEGW
ncbi:hypothetical protein GGX14DRAFT_577548 [Mycena pura]|uniref:Uncharacterized protein n=1 Tax=Mycena pura TaxID=153505 RepID=A0AAD6UT38_9AGAR|nr:hypothetical protein GGX14DRAFT_577548 [Mycena pura]